MLHKILKATLGAGLVLFALVLVSLSALPAFGENGAGIPLTLEWSLDAQVAVHDSEAAQLGLKAATSGVVDALTAKLAGKGAKTETRAEGSGEKGLMYSVRASGSGDTETFRAVMYRDARPQFHLLAGVTEMEIDSPVREGRDMVLVLESNLSTGHSWHVAAGSGMIRSAPHEFERHTLGYGISERQTIRLTPSGTAGPIKLVYKRAWEDQTPTQQVRLTLSSMPATLNLSDPGAPSGPAAGVTGTVYNEVFPAVPATGLPVHFDWRDQGIVTPVKDQGNCGSCWAFGTAGIMESSLWLDGIANTDLSEQFLIDCNKDGWDCNGGWTAHKYHYNYLGKNQAVVGAVLESTKPYLDHDGTCVSNYPKFYKLGQWAFVTGSEYTVPTDEQIKSAIYTYGPITAGVCAGTGWDTYTGSGGIFSTDESSQCYIPGVESCTNHQIILVGWDDTNRYWILKNSWGAGWGIGGYMYIKYGISRVGEGTSWVSGAGRLMARLAVSVIGSGTVSSAPAGISCGARCSASFAGATTVTLTALPASDSNLTSWTGCPSVNGAMCTVNMTTDMTVTATFTLKPPTITGITPANGTVGAGVTITGNYFGSSQGSSTVTFNGVPAPVSSWSDTSITCTVPAGAVTGAVVVRTQGGSATGGTFTVNFPSISSLTPANGAVGDAVTITGNYFGSSRGSVTFNGVPAPVSSWSNTRIVCTVPAGGTGDVVVMTPSRSSTGRTSAVQFTVHLPGIANLSPFSGPAGTGVTVIGNYFGSNRGSSTVTFNGVPASVSSWSGTRITCTVPAGAVTGPVVIATQGGSSTGRTFIVRPRPSLPTLPPRMEPSALQSP